MTTDSTAPGASFAERVKALPEPALFTHELLRNKPKDSVPGDGVHLGLRSLEIVRQSHDEGETSEEIYRWFDADQMLAYGAQCAAAADAKRAAVREAAQGLRVAWAALINEARGSAELARLCIGNTNVQCLLSRCAHGEDALATFDRETA